MRPPVKRNDDKAKNMKKTVKDLLSYMGKYKIALFAVILFSILSTALTVVCPKLMGNATTEIADGFIRKASGNGTMDFDSIYRILLKALILYILGAVFNLFQGLILTEITQKTCYKMREDIIAKTNRIPLSYFDRCSYGQVLSRITNDIDTLGEGLSVSIRQMVSAMTTIIGVTVMMIIISPLMAIIAFVMVPVSGLLMGVLVKNTQKYFRGMQSRTGEVNGIVEEAYSSHIVIKTFNMQDEMIKTFEEAGERLYESSLKSRFISGILFPLMTFVGNLGYIAVTVLGAILTAKGSIGVGDIQAFIRYIKSFNQPLGEIARIVAQLQSVMAAAERVMDYLDTEEETDDESERAANIKTVKGDISFKNVWFSYEDEGVLKGLNIEAKAGERIAIVGPTGAGKTTIVKLLMRFYDLNSGSIAIDGIPVSEFSRKKLRGFFGMVLQDTWLFQGTIMENIRYGKLDATDEEVIEAAKAAKADHFIRSFPGGYNMVINEDASNISRGEKQLITIARAILADRRVLILDEATSSVDTRTEVNIQEAMDRLMEGRTAFIIAHRLSTIKNADTILVMGDGKVVEKGNHDELMALDGRYAELYRAGFSEDNMFTTVMK